MRNKWYVIKYSSIQRAIACLLVFFCIFNFKVNMSSNWSVPVSIFVAILLLLVEMLHRRQFYRDKMRQSTVILWLIFLAGGLVTFIGTQDLGTAKSTWLDFLCLFLIVMALIDYIRDDSDVKAILTVYVLCALLLAFMGMYENITGFHFHVTYESYLVRRNAFGFYPSNTVFYNTNDMASFITISLPIGFMCAEQYKKALPIKIIVLAVLGASAIMSASRSAVLGIIIFAILILIIRKNDSVNFLILIFGGLIFFILADFLSSTYLGQFLTSDGDSGRSLVWVNTLYNAKKAWFMGIGPGCAKVVNGYSQYQSTELLAVHNYFLQIFVEFGIIAFLALLGWFFMLLRRVLLNRKSLFDMGRKVSNYQLAALVVFLIVSISSSDMTSRSWLYAWLAIQFAVTRIIGQTGNRDKVYYE